MEKIYTRLPLAVEPSGEEFGGRGEGERVRRWEKKREERRQEQGGRRREHLSFFGFLFWMTDRRTKFKKVSREKPHFAWFDKSNGRKSSILTSILSSSVRKRPISLDEEEG